MWKFAGSNTDERTFLIDGLNVWALPWQDASEEAAEVRDPIYNQPFTFSVYAVTDGRRAVKFAAGEFSNGVWGFYVPA